MAEEQGKPDQPAAPNQPAAQGSDSSPKSVPPVADTKAPAAPTPVAPTPVAPTPAAPTPAAPAPVAAPPAARPRHGGGGGRGGGGGGRGGGGGGFRGGPQSRSRSGGRRGRGREGDDSPFEDTVVKIFRCSTVVRGGRRFSFAALVVVGDRKGQVGIGYGKDNEVPGAVEKGIKLARKNLIQVKLDGATIPHQILGTFGASKVVLVPAAPGTGVIAGSSVRPVMELAGIHDVLTKRYGSSSPKNLVKAAFSALQNLRTREMVEGLRGVKLEASGQKTSQKAS